MPVSCDNRDPRVTSVGRGEFIRRIPRPVRHYRSRLCPGRQDRTRATPLLLTQTAEPDGQDPV